MEDGAESVVAIWLSYGSVEHVLQKLQAYRSRVRQKYKVHLAMDSKDQLQNPPHNPCPGVRVEAQEDYVSKPREVRYFIRPPSPSALKNTGSICRLQDS